MPLKRVGGVGRAAVILVGLAAIFAALTVIASQTVTDEAEAFLDGATASEDFIESIAPYLLLTFVQGAVVIASMVLVMIWMFRLAANHRSLHRGATWGPGWAIGGWFLPPLLYIIPTIMFRELWRASDPDVPIGGDWKSRPVSPLPIAWFVVYSVIPIALMFARSDTRAVGSRRVRRRARQADRRRPRRRDRQHGPHGRGRGGLRRLRPSAHCPPSTPHW